MWRDGGEFVLNFSFYYRFGFFFFVGGIALVLVGCGTVK